MELALSTAVPPIVAIAILLAIPVVCIALWAEHFVRSPELEKDSEKKSPDDSRLDAESLRARVRWAGLHGILIQLCGYWAIEPLRDSSPWVEAQALGLLAFALWTQSRILSSAESRVPAEADPETAEESGEEDETRGRTRSAFRRSAEDSAEEGAEPDGLSAIADALRAIALTLASMLFFFGFLGTSLLVAHALLLELALPPAIAVWALAAAGILSVLTTTLLLLALAPWQLRTIFPVVACRDPELLARIDSCFSRAGLPTPECYLIRSQDFRFTNAMIAGFARGKGIFRPALFLTVALVEKLSPGELEAVLLHEASHWSLGHLRRRILGGGFALAATLGLSAGLAVVATLLVPETNLPPLRLLLSLATVALPFYLLRGQTANHEREADRHCVLALGARLDDFAHALRKIDALDDAIAGLDPRRDQEAASPARSHPETELRILRVRQALEESLQFQTNHASVFALKKRKRDDQAPEDRSNSAGGDDQAA